MHLLHSLHGIALIGLCIHILSSYGNVVLHGNVEATVGRRKIYDPMTGKTADGRSPATAELCDEQVVRWLRRSLPGLPWSETFTYTSDITAFLDRVDPEHKYDGRAVGAAISRMLDARKTYDRRMRPMWAVRFLEVPAPPPTAEDLEQVGPPRVMGVQPGTKGQPPRPRRIV